MGCRDSLGVPYKIEMMVVILGLLQSVLKNSLDNFLHLSIKENIVAVNLDLLQVWFEKTV